MISKEIQKKIRQIEIQTNRLLSGTLVGQNSSAVKGSGFEFDQLREYQQGDDVRFIDWKSSARMDKLMVRQYIEERSRSIVLLVDISASSFFGSTQKNKYEVLSELAAVLALAGSYAHDHIALLLFSDTVELFIPPGNGQKHVHHLLEKLFTYQPKQVKTSLTAALEYVAGLHLKNAIVFVLSDFIGPSFKKALCVVAKRYDLIAVRCLDKNEIALPAVGFLHVVDSETGQRAYVDARYVTSSMNRYCASRLHDQNKIFNACGVDLLDIKSTQPYVNDMVRFFKKRMLY